MSNDKMIYNDDQSIGVDEKSLDKLNQKQIDQLARILKNVKY